jgi:fructose-1,6-bisphosphatase/inositol monophosphatase family enzyme
MSRAAHPPPAQLLEAIKRIHAQIRDDVMAACARQSTEELSAVSSEASEEGDTIFAIDRVSEERLVAMVEREIASVAKVVLIAEGLHGGSTVLPRGTRAEDAAYRMIVDPIDGTRGLMYQKRSAWILTGLAVNRGPGTRLSDIDVAVQTELPVVKQSQSDMLWAVRGQGAHAERVDLSTGHRRKLPLGPSRSESVAQGFFSISRFFPGGRDVLAALEDELVLRLAGGKLKPDDAYCFEDQYISTGGQLYELMVGHDRFVADLRPLLIQGQLARGWPRPFCCHPYDLASALVAEEAGVQVTDTRGQALDCPLDVVSNVGWVGYANHSLRKHIEPVLQSLLRERGLQEPSL